MKYLLTSCMLFLAAALSSSGPARAQTSPVTVLRNATIYTMDADLPTAGALAMEGGRLLMVGPEAAVMDAYPQAAQTLDAGGRTVVPGLIDAHVHLMGLGESMLEADLVGTASKAEVIDRLRAFADEHDLPEDAWLTGRGWDQNDWPGEKSFPTRADLDQAFPDRPVWLVRIDGHAGWANTAAMKAAGMEQIQEADDPEGGRIVRTDAGAPTGVFVDAAMSLVGRHQPELTTEQRQEALRLALRKTRTHGLTGVHDAGIDWATIRLYREAIDAGEFPLRLYGMVGGRAAFDHFCQEGPLIGYGDRLTIRSVKFYMDGALGSRGAALLDDYADDPGNRGLLRMEPAAFRKRVAEALDCGFQVNTHAIGDRANRIVLDTYEQARTDAGAKDPGRHRVEHAQILAPEDLPRFARLNIIASMQPTHATSDMPWADERLGEKRLEGAYAWKSLLESGAPLAFGSDFPVEKVNPLLGFYAAITRQDPQGTPRGGWLPEERLSRTEALRAFTLGAAYAAFQEDTLGSLEAGKRADFVVLSKDIMEVPPQEILDTEVVATYLDGAPIYGGL